MVCDVLRIKFLGCCCGLVAHSNVLTHTKNQQFLNTLRSSITSTTRKLQVNLEIDIHCTLYTNVVIFCSQTVFRINRVFAMEMLAYLPVKASETFEMFMNECLLELNAIFNLSDCERNFSLVSQVT